MTRSRASAKKAGAFFERLVAEFLSIALGSDFIERRRLAGANDKGDIAGVRTRDGRRVVIEVKDHAGRYEVGPWLKEAERERLNDGASVAMVVAKRRGTTDPSEQVVFMTLADAAKLLGAPDEVGEANG